MAQFALFALQLGLVVLAFALNAGDSLFWAALSVGVAVWLSVSRQISLIARFVDKLATRHDQGANAALTYTFSVERAALTLGSLWSGATWSGLGPLRQAVLFR